MTLNVSPADGLRQASSPPTERVIAIMEMLGAEPLRPFSLAEISRALDISRATGHAIMATLADHDWVSRDPRTAKYTWGAAISGLADARPFRAELEKLAATTGAQVYLAQREDSSLVIVEVVGEARTAPPIGPGTRMPFVAPFGRDYVAWSTAAAQRSWLEGIGSPSNTLRSRMSAVINEIRTRGFVVERLTREYLRVYSALRALGGDGEIDALTTRLARAFADLSAIDVLPGELSAGATHNVATVSAPIFDGDGAVSMSVTAAPFTILDAAAITRLGEQVRATAADIARRRNGHDNIAGGGAS